MEKKKTLILRIIWVVAWIAVIWGHSMQKAVVSEEESGAWLDVLNAILAKFSSIELTMYFVRKAAHFTEYFILGALVMSLYRQVTEKIINYISAPALGCLMICFIDETIQLFVEGRSGQVSDMWIDFIGSLISMAISLFFIYNKNKKNSIMEA